MKLEQKRKIKNEIKKFIKSIRKKENTIYKSIINNEEVEVLYKWNKFYINKIIILYNWTEEDLKTKQDLEIILEDYFLNVNI